MCEKDEESQGTVGAMNDVEGKDNDSSTNSKENKGDEGKKDEDSVGIKFKPNWWFLIKGHKPDSIFLK